MKVCLFGSYVKDPMNELLKKKLELQNVKVVECNEEIHGIGSFFFCKPQVDIKTSKN